MKTAGRIIYWIVALGLVSAVLVSLGYSWTQALLISLVVFGPCSLALEFLFPKAKKTLDKVWLSLAVFVAAFSLILLVHHWLWEKSQIPEYQWVIDVKPALINPVFLGIIFTVLALGDVTIALGDGLVEAAVGLFQVDGSGCRCHEGAQGEQHYRDDG